MLTGALLVLIGRPSWAGHYELLENEPVGSGSVAITCDDPSSPYYPAPAPYDPHGIPVAATTKKGTVSHSASETFHFQWVRNIDPTTGQPDPNDDPALDIWQVTYDIELGFQYSEFADEDGSGSVFVTVDGVTYSGSATGQHAIFDYGTGQMTQQWSFQSGFNGEPSVTVPLYLSGEDPAVTVDASGSATLEGDIEGGIVYLARRAPAAGVEGIDHTSPTEDQQISEGNDAHPGGNWSGVKRARYVIQTYYNAPDVPDAGWISNGNLGPATATGGVTAWTGAAVHMGWRGVWNHWARLMGFNPQTGQYDNYRVHHIRHWFCTET